MITNEDMKKAVLTIINGCDEREICKDCPFARESNNEWECSLVGLSPVEWDINMKGEPEKHYYVPYDLSNKEIRDALLGKRIRSNDGCIDVLVTAIFKSSPSEWSVNKQNLTSKQLVENFVFDDTGLPVGMEVNL